MSRTTLGLSMAILVLMAVSFYLHAENRKLSTQLDELQDALAQLRSNSSAIAEELAGVRSELDEIRESIGSELAACDTEFPAGVYRLVTRTNYGPDADSEYEIYHVSITLAQWRLNVGMRLNSFGIPTDFYLDYDGDGRIDTPLAARFVRELPVVGNTIADRLLADSRVHQSLYAVFSCEWRNAAYTSAEDMNDSVSETSAMLWNLVQQHSADILEWIRLQ